MTVDAAETTPADAGPRGPLARALARLRIDIDPALRPAVADEQLRMVLGHTRLGILVATAFAVFFALQLRGDAALPAWAVDAWLAAKLAVACGRIATSPMIARRQRRRTAAP